MALPAWVELLGSGLPARVRLGPDESRSDGGWCVELAGALYALVNAADLETCGLLSAQLLADGRLTMDGALRTWLRRPRAAGDRAAGLLARFLERRLLEGATVAEGLTEAVESLPCAEGVHDAFDGWRSVAEELKKLIVALSYGDSNREAPRSLHCRDRWLGWIHGRAREQAGTGRPHHLHRFLVLICGDEACTYRVNTLQARLAGRLFAPTDWGEIVEALLFRKGWQHDHADELRSVPLAHAVSSWGRLTRARAELSYGEALTALASEVGVAQRAAWSPGLPPPVQFESGPDGLRPQSAGHAGDASAPARWLPDVVREDSGEPLMFAPGEAAAAALAFALHEAADNLALGWMPSLLLWGPFWSELQPWLQEHAAALTGRTTLEGGVGYADPWALHRADGQPWSASRLFDAAMALLVEGSGPLATLGHRQLCGDRPEVHALIPSLLACLDRFEDRARRSAELRRAVDREPGLRWRGAEAYVEGDTRDITNSNIIISNDMCEACDLLAAKWMALRDTLGLPAPDVDGELAALFRGVHSSFHLEAGHGMSAARAAVQGEARHFWRAHLGAAGQVWCGASSATRELARLEEGFSAAIQRLEDGNPPAPPHVEVRTTAAQRAWLHIAGQRAELHLEPSGGSVPAAMRFPPDDFRLRWALDEASARLQTQRADPMIPRLIGDALGGLLSRQLWDLLHQGVRSADGSSLQLKLVLERPWDALPWELLRDPGPPGFFLCLDERLSMARVLPAAALRAPPPTPSSPRVLFVQSGLPLAATEAELRAVRAYAHVECVTAATRRSLAGALSADVYTGMHLACHGETGTVMLNDGPLADEELAALVGGRVSGFCLLHLCWGASAETRDLPGLNWTGLGARLVEGGVPDVVGLSTQLRHDEAGTMAQALYGALGDGLDVGSAAAAARRALHRLRPAGGTFGLVVHLSTARRMC